MDNYIKTLILKYAPDFWLLHLKKIHYSYSVKRMIQEEKDLEYIRKIVKTGSVVIDIGANVGVYTIALSREVGDSGAIYSFEPILSTYEILVSNVRHMSLKNVTTINMGLSEKKETLLMEIPHYDEGGENYYQSRIVDKANLVPDLRHYEINVTDLDSYLKEKKVEAVDFIKIDVEGHELNVIKGALTTLDTFKPAMFIEVSGSIDEAGTNAQLVNQLIVKRGYKCCVLDGDAIRERQKGDIRINYYYIPEERAHVY